MRKLGPKLKSPQRLRKIVRSCATCRLLVEEKGEWKQFQCQRPDGPNYHELRGEMLAPYARVCRGWREKK